MKFVVRIDPDSIKKNPDAGRTSFFVAGMIHNNPDGSMSREVQQMHQMTPDPNYTCEVLGCDVVCDECGKIFPHEELEERRYGGGWDDEWYDVNVCPYCEEVECCELEYEQFNNVTGEVISNE